MRLPGCWWLAILGVLWLDTVAAKSVAGDRMLVLLPSEDAAAEHKWFLRVLGEDGFSVAVRAASNTSVVLHQDGARLYDHAVLLAPKASKLGGKLGAGDFVRFVEDGGNLIVAGSSELSDTQRRLAKQFGVDYEPRGAHVVDMVHHFSNNSMEDPQIVGVSEFPSAPTVLSEGFSTPYPGTVYYRGTGFSYAADNPLLIPVMVGQQSTVSVTRQGRVQATANGDAPLSGRALGLFAVFQARNNARVAFSGSADMFTDAAISLRGGINLPFLRDIIAWVRQEKSVLRATRHSHYLADAPGERPEHYRVGDRMVYEIDLSVYERNEWKPYTADDVQLEVTMLDPHIRATLNRTHAVENDGVPAMRYRGDIRLPDRYGTFTFRVNYKRRGLSAVDVRETVGIWPLRHDGYPRFLVAAYPYYAGSLAMAVGFLALSAAWLWTGDAPAQSKRKTK
ncbi:oligosaccharyl transferase glycoprotein complex, beta subunit [Coemansia sp. Benny D115]|nr:oligosaccharyl transferase glycoprotein complex, beta subunit [Coemansia sp. Benny D115]